MPSALGHIGAGLLQGVGSSMVKKEEAQAKREEQAAAELRAKSLASWTRDNITIPAEERANIQADKTATNLAANKIKQIEAKGVKKTKRGEMPKYVKSQFETAQIQEDGTQVLDINDKPVMKVDYAGLRELNKLAIKYPDKTWDSLYQQWESTNNTAIAKKKKKEEKERKMKFNALTYDEQQKKLDSLPSKERAAFVDKYEETIKPAPKSEKKLTYPEKQKAKYKKLGAAKKIAYSLVGKNKKYIDNEIEKHVDPELRSEVRELVNNYKPDENTVASGFNNAINRLKDL